MVFGGSLHLRNSRATVTLYKSGKNKIMTSNEETDNSGGRRSDPRTIIGKYYSVEFSLSDLEFIYQFKIWDMSTNGMCLLVKEDSKVLNHVKVGDVLDMKYYPTEVLSPIKSLKTEVKHITKDEQGRFKGHFMVGLSILDKQASDSS